MKVYLAGPEVFLENAIEIGFAKKELCKKYGIIGLFPFDNEIGQIAHNERVDHIIYNANVSMMIAADCGIFNLTPFRGPSADVGTVFELGLMIGMKKQVFGYTNAKGSLVSRMAAQKLVTYGENGRPRDNLGMYIENFDNSDNLMIDSSLMMQGHPLVENFVESDKLYENLEGFETCLKMIVEKSNLQSKPISWPDRFILRKSL